MAAGLPTFENPPVVEVVMGLQFEPLDSLLAPHVGLFWNSVRDAYPVCEERPPIGSATEDFAQPSGLLPRFDFFSRLPLPRILLKDSIGEWLIQVQRDRFLHNWRQVGDRSYPRYPVARTRFFERLQDFSRFLEANNIGPLKLEQLEITYLNHIAPWDTSNQIGDVFPDFAWRKDRRVNSPPEACSVSCSFLNKEHHKRLRATISPGRNESRGTLLSFELTVRGRPISNSLLELEQWFDQSRAWIVTTFKDMTSEPWHEQWQLHESHT